jgi:thiamine-phosphate pyrophosphorylase
MRPPLCYTALGDAGGAFGLRTRRAESSYPGNLIWVIPAEGSVSGPVSTRQPSAVGQAHVEAARFQLHLITERLGVSESWLPRVVAAAAGGVDWVQLRDKSACALDLYEHARSLLAAMGRGPGATRRARLSPTLPLPHSSTPRDPLPCPGLSINDRLDVALAVGADGVHLAGKSLPVGSACRLAEGRLVVGRSVHSVEEAREAAAEGADYVTFGHVFPTHSKPGSPPRGPEHLAEVVAAVDVPVLAIGGINLGNLEAVLATGCAGVAVISAILSAADPEQAARDLRHALDGSPHRPRIPGRGSSVSGHRDDQHPALSMTHDPRPIHSP